VKFNSLLERHASFGARMHGTDPEQSVFPSSAPPGRGERQVAVVVVLVSAGIFLSAVPFARFQLPQALGFIPIYQSALAIIDLVTAALLFAQFWILRTRALF
jgi:two-component system, sensor histidine kinase and response regulator